MQVFSEELIRQVTNASEMGLSRTQTHRLLSIPRDNVDKIAKDRGLKFKTMRESTEYKEQKAEASRARAALVSSKKLSPYKSNDKKVRDAEYKKLLKGCSTSDQRKELTYGYCVHEFELNQSAQGKRPPLPDFDSRFRTVSNARVSEARNKVYQEQKAFVLGLIAESGHMTSASIAAKLNVDPYVAHNLMDSLFRKNLVDRYLSKRTRESQFWVYIEVGDAQ